jgi:DNA polymerase-1
MKRAMIRTWRDLKRRLPEVRMLLSVHDELVFEVPERQVEDAQALIRTTMERAAAMSVPLVVEVGHGESWEKAH